jgi:hypothetical protein
LTVNKGENGGVRKLVPLFGQRAWSYLI